MNDRQYAIQLAFKGKLVGKKIMKQHVAEVLSLMPEEVITFVTENVWFVTSYDESWAFAFTGNDFQNKHVIFFSDELFYQSPQQIHWTIAHEIGHVVLGHKNRFSEKFSKKIVQEQEDAADEFAREYVKEIT